MDGREKFKGTELSGACNLIFHHIPKEKGMSVFLSYA